MTTEERNEVTSLDKPVTIYAGMDGIWRKWFKNLMFAKCFPLTQYTRTDAAIEALEGLKYTEFNSQTKIYNQAIHDAIQAIQSLGDK